jgi:hypothetical protein
MAFYRPALDFAAGHGFDEELSPHSSPGRVVPSRFLFSSSIQTVVESRAPESNK